MATLTGCAAELRQVPADWENPGHRLVGEELQPLLQTAGRDPKTCEVVFLETPHLNAASLGSCRFAFTTGLAATSDRDLIAGVAAHEVAHDALSHAEKRELAGGTTRALIDALFHVPGWGPVAGLGVAAISWLVLPTYSRTQEAAADAKAVELLRAEGDPHPPETMAHTFEVLLAREGASGNEIVATHPNIRERIAEMRALQAREQAVDPAQPAVSRQTVPAANPLQLGQALSRKVDVRESTPPDPRADWSVRYKRLGEIADEQTKEANQSETLPR